MTDKTSAAAVATPSVSMPAIQVYIDMLPLITQVALCLRKNVLNYIFC